MPTTQKGRLLEVTTPLEYDFLLIERVRSSEGLSQLFRFDLELVHEEDSAGDQPTLVDPQQMLGQPMTVCAGQADGAKRYFNGICIDFSQGHRNERFSEYRAEIVPRVWLLTQISQSRIFQNISVPDILRKVLEGFEFSIEVQGTFEQRNYCVQYRETDWNFATRLMEEEGIYYYFEHTESSHKLIIANADTSHRDCPAKSEIPFVMDISADQEEWSGSVYDWRSANKLRAGKFSLRDHNFQLPTNNLEALQLSRFNTGGNQQLENYDYPGEYAKRFDGISSGGGEQASELQKVFDDRQRTVKIRQEEIDVAYHSSLGTSDCCSMTAGCRFKLTSHPNSDYNRNHILVNVETVALQSPSYITGDLESSPYVADFSCIPQGEGMAPFRPPRHTAKPIVQGSQTAVVVGPGGEEIFTDKYGRVKVQFRWDRDGQANASSSCWIRVVQTWAGKKWGTMFIPRIGMEVVVDFLEGDPDQPIITGCVYNPDTMPPYTLPDEKTKSTIKTDSSKGSNGFNELRFEDKKGDEQIFIHAEKDQDIRVKNDCKEIIKHDRHLIVENDQYEKVKKDKHLQVVGDHNEKIGGTMSLNVGSDLQEKVTKNYALDAGMEVHIKAGMKAVIEAGTQITLKVGGNFIDINPSGVTIKGMMVLINSGGAAGSGSGSSPEAPKDPKEADTADAGERVAAMSAPSPVASKTLGPLASLMKGAAQSGSPFCDM
jgi:type VI secretion system secreted protein VgrG